MDWIVVYMVNYKNNIITSLIAFFEFLHILFFDFCSSIYMKLI